MGEIKNLHRRTAQGRNKIGKFSSTYYNEDRNYFITSPRIMNTDIKATGISLTPAISDYIEKRLKRISKLIKGDRAARVLVEVGKTSNHHNKGDIFRAEIRIVGTGKDLYVSSEKPDLYAAIDDASDEILRELSSSKDRKLSRMRRSGLRVKTMMKGLWPWK